MGSGGALPVRAVFVRRWQVEALPIDPGSFVVRSGTPCRSKAARPTWHTS